MPHVIHKHQETACHGARTAFGTELDTLPHKGRAFVIPINGR
jgi:hypothetical protein